MRQIRYRTEVHDGYSMGKSHFEMLLQCALQLTAKRGQNSMVTQQSTGKKR